MLPYYFLVFDLGKIQREWSLNGYLLVTPSAANEATRITFTFICKGDASFNSLQPCSMAFEEFCVMVMLKINGLWDGSDDPNMVTHQIAHFLIYSLRYSIRNSKVLRLNLLTVMGYLNFVHYFQGSPICYSGSYGSCCPPSKSDSTSFIFG